MDMPIASALGILDLILLLGYDFLRLDSRILSKQGEEGRKILPRPLAGLLVKRKRKRPRAPLGAAAKQRFPLLLRELADALHQPFYPVFYKNIVHLSCRFLCV